MKRFSILFLLFPALLHAQLSNFCSGTTNGFVVDFALYQNDLYATGFFNKICGQNTGYIGRWNGTQWVQGAQGGIDIGHALEVVGDALLIASYEFGTDSNYIVRWNGTTLSTLGTVYRTNPNPDQSQTASVYDILEYDNNIVACGEFNRINGLPVRGIAQWDGVKWDSLGSGLSGSFVNGPPILYPHQMVLFNGDLIVCGNFTKAGGQTVNGIARWDGTQWHPIGAGFNSTVYGIGVFNGQLYAGGDFTASGDTELSCIARWNGAEWESPGFGFAYSGSGAYAFIHTIKPVGDSLFISGGFNQVLSDAGPVLSGSGVVALNAGLQLNLLNGGTPGKEIEALIAYDGGVLFGGGPNNGTGYLGFWNPASSAVEDWSAEPAPEVSPNPATGYLFTSAWTSLGYQRLTLFDLQGNICCRLGLMPGDERVELPDLPSGMYVLQFEGSKTSGPVREKLVIQR
ncbi:MAG: T9SS type A sorting domain-containing protein [Saprospiraceae bacterium]